MPEKTLLSSYLNVSEAWGHVYGHVLVALLEPVVLLDVVKVVTTDHHRVLHLKMVKLGAQHQAILLIHVYDTKKSPFMFIVTSFCIFWAIYSSLTYFPS